MAQSLIEIAKELTVALIQTGNILLKTCRRHSRRPTQPSQRSKRRKSRIPAPGARCPITTSGLAKKHHQTCNDLPGMRAILQAVVHPPSEAARARRPILPDKYGIPRSQPLAARETTARRRQVVQETRPWEKAPAYRKGHAGIAPASPAPEAEAVPDETEAASAAAPPQPKRQRKTTPKKTARKTRSEG